MKQRFPRMYKFEGKSYLMNDGRVKRHLIKKTLGIEDYDQFIRKLYKDGMSGVEIAEYILRETGVTITPRSIQRIINNYGEMRPIREAFHNAMKRGRVVWQLDEDRERQRAAKHQISRKMRMEILKRDGFACKLCGFGRGQGALLQVDHIIARVNGGEDTFDNLRTLCIDCNVGKQLVEGEYLKGEKAYGFKSGNIGEK